MKISPLSNQISEMLNESSASRSSVRQEISRRKLSSGSRKRTQSEDQMIGRVMCRPKAPS